MHKYTWVIKEHTKADNAGWPFIFNVFFSLEQDPWFLSVCIIIQNKTEISHYPLKLVLTAPIRSTEEVQNHCVGFTAMYSVRYSSVTKTETSLCVSVQKIPQENRGK